MPCPQNAHGVRMSIQSLQEFALPELAILAALPARARAPVQNDHVLAMALLRDGVISAHDLVQALAQVKTGGGRLMPALMAAHPQPDRLYAAIAGFSGLGVADLLHVPPDPRLIDRLGAAFCTAHHILPWRDSGGTTVIATPHPDVFLQHYARLIATFGPVSQALAPQQRIDAALLAARGPQLARLAETFLPLKDSCREFQRATRGRLMLLSALGLAALAVLPLTLSILLIWAAFTLALTAVMKLGAVLSRPRVEKLDDKVVIARLPVVSIMVGLYKESDIAIPIAKLRTGKKR